MKLRFETIIIWEEPNISKHDVLTTTTYYDNEQAVEYLVRRLSPHRSQDLSFIGNPEVWNVKERRYVAEVFETVEDAKRVFAIHAWGLANATLEDVFIDLGPAWLRVKWGSEDVRK